MAAYLDLAGFKTLSTMPSSFVVELQAAEAGWIDGQLAAVSAYLDARLAKHYAAPFDADNPPLIVKLWLARIVTRAAYQKRGIDPNDATWETANEDAKQAEAELLEAANTETGLFDLPLRSNTTDSATTKGGPFVYSEQSPYVWADVQREAAYVEDLSGSGTDG